MLEDSGGPGVARLQRISVVITNYNYARYVAAAVESALALRWDDVEVVVVDDGSTDDSADVLAPYSDRVRLIFAANGGQRVAANRGFAATSGDAVVFLDADDLLPPDLGARAAEVWSPVVSKVQFRMQRVGVDGQPFGPPFPDWRRVPSAEQVRRWLVDTSAYPTPPGSGNVYARWFLERILPVDASVGDFIDSACLAAAPLHGDVVTVPDVVVGYRQHGANDSDLLAEGSRFVREVERARARFRFAQRSIGVADEELDERPLYRSRELLQFRVAAARLTPDTAVLRRDGWWWLVVDTVRSPLHPGPEPARVRLLVLVWCLAVLAAPRRLVRPLLVRRWGRR